MATLNDLKKIYLLQDLTDPMLEKMLPKVAESRLDTKQVVFEEGQAADNFYMLKSGKVLLKVDVSPTVTISLGSVKPGYSFGWSSLLGEGATFTSQAVCAEPSDLLVIPGPGFREILDADQIMGYRVMDGVVRILEQRLRRRTDQFIKTLRRQMEIWDVW
ncbi:MAG: cyclic nucleotide-binding domain-containing protein [Deltaproteobacteria bacterium]|nr:cyclic nucleotide-binding domain-containing protein [Deltaproteobacteria bacterium]